MNRTARYVTLLLYEMARHRAIAQIAETAEIRDGHLETADACWAGAVALRNAAQHGKTIIDRRQYHEND